ncbi:hypothetical protein EU538_10405 [Candidatus Thorarchaeota archaeon]|nr:MAG: hypothetical protein EU538_10405 [Candidatus Thorarchaeota archaeon]
MKGCAVGGMIIIVLATVFGFASVSYRFYTEGIWIPQNYLLLLGLVVSLSFATLIAAILYLADTIASE